MEKGWKYGLLAFRIRRCLRVATVAFSAAIMASGCSEGENENAVHVATLYDVVELKEQSNGQTVFELYLPDSDEAVTLTAEGSVFDDSDEMAPGDCLFLAYTPVDGNAYESGPITVEAWGRTTNEALMQGEPESLEGWDSDGVWLMSLWRAGGKVVMRVRLTYDVAPRLFALVVDKTTIEDEYPEAYLVHIRKSDVPNFMRQYYITFDVSALWTYQTCKGLRIHVNNSNMPEANLFVVEKLGS